MLRCRRLPLLTRWSTAAGRGDLFVNVLKYKTRNVADRAEIPWAPSLCYMLMETPARTELVTLGCMSV